MFLWQRTSRLGLQQSFLFSAQPGAAVNSDVRFKRSLELHLFFMMLFIPSGLLLLITKEALESTSP